MKLAEDVFSEIMTPLQQVESRLREILERGAQPASQITLHLLEAGGKRVRPVMALLAARSVGGDPFRVVPVAVAAEMIHMATLVHDDIIDSASTRRGRATANHLWGNAASVLTGDSLLAKALVLLVDESTPAIVRVMSGMVDRMCEGEICQMLTAGDIGQDEELYFDRIKKKTALFFEACCRAGAMMCDASDGQVDAIAAYGLNIGMAFQIVDDVLDVQSESAAVGKPVGNDLASGVITLPVIHLLKDPKQRALALPHLEKSARTPHDIQAVLELVRRHGAVDSSYRVAGEFARQAKMGLDVLPPGRSKELLIDIADYVLARSS